MTALTRSSLPTASTSAPLGSRSRVNIARPTHSRSMSKKNTTRVTRAAFNPLDPDSTNDPLLKKAMKEPVAFFGGMFAGMLGLSVNDEPLREWVDKTSEAAGMTREEAIAGSAGAGEDDDDDDLVEKEDELEPATATKETEAAASAEEDEKEDPKPASV